MPQAQYKTPARSNLIPRSRPEKKTGLKYTVVENGFNGERVVYETDDRELARNVASQHAARRVVEE